MKKRVLRIDEVPEGTRLYGYLELLKNTLEKQNQEKYRSFVENLFQASLKFLKENLGTVFFPTITVRLVHNHEKFQRYEMTESQDALSKEVARFPATAFIVGNRFKVQIFIDFDVYHSLLNHGYLTFIMNLVMTYFHELLHALFPHKHEQEIHILGCHFVERFLGVNLPDELRNSKASDYYYKREDED